MATRNISLTDHFDRYIDEVIASGRYQNASEVVRDSLRLHEERERERQKQLATLKAALAEADDDIANGRYIEFETDEAYDDYLEVIWRKHRAKYDSHAAASGPTE